MKHWIMCNGFEMHTFVSGHPFDQAKFHQQIKATIENRRKENAVADIVALAVMPLSFYDSEMKQQNQTHDAICVKFAMLSMWRHPVKQAVSLLYYLQDAHWEWAHKPHWKNIMLLDFYQS